MGTHHSQGQTFCSGVSKMILISSEGPYNNSQLKQHFVLNEEVKVIVACNVPDMVWKYCAIGLHHLPHHRIATFGHVNDRFGEVQTRRHLPSSPMEISNAFCNVWLVTLNGTCAASDSGSCASGTKGVPKATPGVSARTTLALLVVRSRVSQHGADRFANAPSWIVVVCWIRSTSEMVKGEEGVHTCEKSPVHVSFALEPIVTHQINLTALVPCGEDGF